jgi:hypothetical protein
MEGPIPRPRELRVVRQETESPRVKGVETFNRTALEREPFTEAKPPARPMTKLVKMMALDG